MSRLWMWTGAGGLLAGLLIGLWWGNTDPVTEPPAPPVRQADGSLVLERVQPSSQPQKPSHAMPKGAREERRVSVVVQPPRGTVATGKRSLQVGDHVVGPHEMVPDHVPDARKVADSCDCPPVQVDLSLVRMPDKTRRVVASSPTGQILSGIDIPIEPLQFPRSRPWAVGLTLSTDRKVGGFLDRDIGPLRLGVEAYQTRTGWAAQARAGIRF